MNLDTTSRSSLATEEQLRLLIDGAEDYAMLLLTADGKVASWNRGASRILGWSAGEIVGQPFSKFYPAAEVAACCSAMPTSKVRFGNFSPNPATSSR